MCRDKRYKYVYRYNRGFEEFYDLLNDPDEIHNCIEEMKHSEVYYKLHNEVLKYEMQWGPDGCISDGDFNRQIGELLDPTVNGKYHLWSNMQFQIFNEVEPSEKAKQFVKELEKVKRCTAFSRYDVEKFNESKWNNFFENEFTKFSNEEL